MRETDETRPADEPTAAEKPTPRPTPDPAEPERAPSGAIEGADRAALGTAEPPPGAPPGASVDATESVVPGAHFDRPLTEAKPWFTSLAAESQQAGVANEPTDDDEAG